MRFSEARTVQASVVARLLGIRLLTVHASVVISPEPPVDASPLRGVPPRAIGSRLSDAERLLDEAASTMAASGTDGAGG